MDELHAVLTCDDEHDDKKLRYTSLYVECVGLGHGVGVEGSKPVIY